MKQKRVLMKDIAAKAGVHQTTVSLALRNHPSLRQKTRDRIRKLADEMGYRPDPALSALIAYRQSTKQNQADQVIAFIVNCRDERQFNESHVHRQLVEGARDRANELGYKLDIFWFGRDYKTSQSLDRVLKTRGIQGIILGAFDQENLGLELDWDHFSVVKINILPLELSFETVLSNQMFGVRLAMSELREHSLRHVGLAVADHDEAHNRNLFTAGYLVGQRHLDSSDIVPPLIFQRKPKAELLPEVIEWGRAHKLQAILSNWNYFDEAAWALTTEYGQSCRFVPLDADDRTQRYGGVVQNHPLIGKRAVDQVVGQIKTFRRGPEEVANMTMVQPTWLPLQAWPPKNFLEGKNIAVPQTATP